MRKYNCWEFKKCGREPGGGKSVDLGVCPAAIEGRTNKINSGSFGGRTCWAVTGTLCGGKIQGSFASKLANCMNCDFYKIVQNEEGPTYQSAKSILQLLKNS